MMLCVYQGVGDENVFLLLFKQRVRDNYNQNWHVEIMNSRTAITYRTLVSNVTPQLYLSSVTRAEHRVALTHFRVRSNYLHV